MSAPRKTVFQYEQESVWHGSCLVHHARGVARKVYIMRNGPLPSHLAVCHTCDTPGCILSAHHFVGTWGDNVRDAVRKGRHSCFRKGGVRFAGPHTEATRKKISEASKRMWEARRGS